LTQCNHFIDNGNKNNTINHKAINKLTSLYLLLSLYSPKKDKVLAHIHP